MSNIAFLDLYQIDNKRSIQLNKKYCQLNNYKFIQKKSTYIDKLFQFIITNIQKYDYLVIANQNITISNPNIKIEDLIDDQHQLFMSHGYQLIANSQNIIKASALINGLLEKQNSLYIGNFTEFCQILKKQNYNLINNLKDVALNINGINSDFIIIKCNFKMKRFFKECKKIYLMMKFNFYSLTNIIGFILQNPIYNNILNILNDDVQGYLSLNVQEFKYDVDKSFILNTKNIKSNEIENKLKDCKLNKWWIQK